jgi:hypothetical protein
MVLKFNIEDIKSTFSRSDEFDNYFDSIRNELSKDCLNKTKYEIEQILIDCIDKSYHNTLKKSKFVFNVKNNEIDDYRITKRLVIDFIGNSNAYMIEYKGDSNTPELFITALRLIHNIDFTMSEDELQTKKQVFNDYSLDNIELMFSKSIVKRTLSSINSKCKQYVTA